jgi:hypothetical protein
VLQVCLHGFWWWRLAFIAIWWEEINRAVRFCYCEI